jgi:hypothetical protein
MSYEAILFILISILMFELIDIAKGFFNIEPTHKTLGLQSKWTYRAIVFIAVAIIGYGAM